MLSGMATISLVLLTLLKSVDHLVIPYAICCMHSYWLFDPLLYSQVCQYPIYAGVIKFIKDILMGANVEVSWVDSSVPVESYKEAIKPNTKVIFPILSFLHII